MIHRITRTLAAAGLAAVAVAGPLAAGTASAAPAPAPKPAPTLGEYQYPEKGFGQVAPATFDRGGDPTGMVFGLRWQGWGRPQAHGNGTAYYDPPDQPVSSSVAAPARVIASNLGTCPDGKYAYRTVRWYFPTKGEGPRDAHGFDDICATP